VITSAPPFVLGTGLMQHTTGCSCIATLCVFWRPITLQTVTVVSEELAAHVSIVGWKLRPENGDSIYLRNLMFC
jgi:hypothetical protein